VGVELDAPQCLAGLSDAGGADRSFDRDGRTHVMARLDVTLQRLRVGEAGEDGDGDAEWEMFFVVGVADNLQELETATYEVRQAPFRNDSVTDGRSFEGPVQTSFEDVDPSQAIVIIGGFGLERDAGPAGNARDFDLLPLARAIIFPPLTDLQISVIGESFREPTIAESFRGLRDVGLDPLLRVLGADLNAGEFTEFSYATDWLLDFT
jgi:hypothetical protein